MQTFMVLTSAFYVNGGHARSVSQKISNCKIFYCNFEKTESF